MDDMAKQWLDDQTADSLLAGHVSPDDAPPGYQKLSELVIAARAPGEAGELTHEASVVSLAAETARAIAKSEVGAPPRRSAQRTTALSRLFAAKAAAATAVAVLGVGTAAAAATGNLPRLTSPDPVSHTTSGLATGSASPSSARSTTTAGGPAGYTADGQTLFGLCTAYLARHPAAATGSSVQSAPFKALTTAHGGDPGTTAYCNAYVNSHQPGRRSTTSTSSTTARPSTTTNPSTTAEPVATTPSTAKATGKPAATTHGKPADAGSSHSSAPVSTPNPGGTNTANRGASGNGTDAAATNSHAANTPGSAKAASHSNSQGGSSAGSANAGGHSNGH